MLKLFHSLDLKLKSCLIALFGSAFLAFGLYHVHSFSGVTEGGVLGMTLLLDHWFHTKIEKPLTTLSFVRSLLFC